MCWGNVCNNIRKQACPELFSCVCVFCANPHKTRRGKFKGQNTQNQRKSQKMCLAFPPWFSCDFSSPSSLQPPPNILAVSAPVCKDIQKRQRDRTTIRLHMKKYLSTPKYNTLNHAFINKKHIQTHTCLGGMPAKTCTIFPILSRVITLCLLRAFTKTSVGDGAKHAK